MVKRSKVKILVTAGPTWVRLDPVRVLTNNSTGRTGLGIAETFKKGGFAVTLLLGPLEIKPQVKGVKVLRFKYFSEFRSLVNKEIKDSGCRAVIHSAAVADYGPAKRLKGKIPSSAKTLSLRLKVLPKIIKDIRRTRKDIFLVQFKLEVNKSKKALIAAAHKSLIDNDSDLVVANGLRGAKTDAFKSYLIDKNKKVKTLETRKELAKELLARLRQEL